MASQIAYAPQADLDNTLFGQLSKAMELNQRLQSQRVQQKMMEQHLSQSAQEFPLQLQSIQADTAMKQQQLSDAQAMSGSKVDAAAQEVNLLKAHVASAKVVADNAQKLTDMQLKLDDLAANRETTLNSYLDRQEQQKLNIGDKQAQALGLSNFAQEANNNVLAKMLDQKLRSGDVGVDQQKADLQNTIERTATLSAQLQMMQSDHEMRAIDQLSKFSESERNVLVDQAHDSGVFAIFKKNRELLNDQHMMNFKDLLEKNIMLDPTLGSARLPPDTMGMVLGPDGQMHMGSTRDINRNAYKQILDKTTGVIQRQMGNVTAASKAVGASSDNNLYGSSVISPEKKAQLETKIKVGSAGSYMKAVDRLGDDTLSRGIYHATQQTSLDGQPLASAAGYSEYNDMLNKQPLSTIITNGFENETTNKQGAQQGYALNEQDRGTFNKYLTLGSGVAVDPNNAAAAADYGYDPQAKPSQVLLYRSMVDALARMKGQYVTRTQQPTTPNQYGSSTPVERLVPTEGPKRALTPDKLFGNQQKLLQPLSEVQHRALISLAFKMGLINEDGTPKDINSKDAGTFDSFTE